MISLTLLGQQWVGLWMSRNANNDSNFWLVVRGPSSLTHPFKSKKTRMESVTQSGNVSANDRKGCKKNRGWNLETHRKGYGGKILCTTGTETAENPLGNLPHRHLLEGLHDGEIPATVTDPRSRYRLWRWSDVTHWLTTQLGEADFPDDRFLTVLNASLELRRHRDDLAPANRNRLYALAGLP